MTPKPKRLTARDALKLSAKELKEVGKTREEISEIIDIMREFVNRNLVDDVEPEPGVVVHEIAMVCQGCGYGLVKDEIRAICFWCGSNSWALNEKG